MNRNEKYSLTYNKIRNPDPKANAIISTYTSVSFPFYI